MTTLPVAGMLTLLPLFPGAPAPPQDGEEAPFTGKRDWERRGREPDWGEEAPGEQVVPQKALPIVGAPLADLDALANPVADSDLVIGLAAGGLARAYPLKVLGGPQREIINDRLGAEPFAVNW